MEELFKGENHLYCPLCGQTHILSSHLKEVFADAPKSLWLANMITHYRHYHIESWNRCWGYNGNHYRRQWFGDYYEEKVKVNERAKRQIVRKAKPFLQYHKIGLKDFEKLQNNDEKTIALIKKNLNSDE